MALISASEARSAVGTTAMLLRPREYCRLHRRRKPLIAPRSRVFRPAFEPDWADDCFR